MTIHKVGASTFLFGVSLFPPFLQTSYRHLGLVSRRHEVELFNVVTEVSAVTEQQRTRKHNGSVARSMLPMKSSPFNQMTCQLKLLPHVFQQSNANQLMGACEGKIPPSWQYMRTQEPTFCDVAPAETTGVPAF